MVKISFLISTLVFFASCNNNADKIMLGDVEDSFESIRMIPSTKQPPPNSKNTSESISQKLIKTGGLNFQSEDVEKDYQRIQELLSGFEAYIENENQSKTAQQISYELTIRVPSAKYDSLYVVLSDIAYQLDNKYSNVEDVTERYYDLKTRIKNKKALEARYVELLNKASEVKDMLEIEKNLNEVRTEIERLQGQFNYLSKQISLSTIRLTFYEELPYVYDSSQRKGFGARILSALDNGWQGFLSFLVWIATLWPFVLLVVAGIYVFRKWRSRKQIK